MTDSNPRPLKVFLCHASADKPAVRKLYRYLRSKGMDPWLDAEKLLPGQRWETEIPKALYASDAIIVFLSKNSITKEGYVQREIKFALDKALDLPEGRIFLIPARLEECEIPESLKGYQWVDLFQKNWNRRLMSSLNERITQLGLTLLSNTGETQPPVTSSPSHAQFITSEAEESPVEPKPTAELHPRQSDISSDQEIYFHLPLVSDKEPKDKIYREVVDPATPERSNQEKSVEISHKSAEKGKIIFNPKLRQFIAVFGGLLLTTLCIMGGVSYLSNTLFDRLVTITPSPPSTFSAISADELRTGTAIVADTLTPIAKSTEAVISQTPVSPHTIGETMTSEKDQAILVFVPEGEFLMGSNYEPPPESAPTYYDFRPQFSVTLNAFWIDQTEVTNKQYARCVSAGDCTPPLILKSPLRSSYYGDPQYEDYPVIYVDWYMARAYCEWAGRRLPTEAEWEKAARGPDGRIYPWGNDPPNDTLLNYNNYWTDTSVVRQYPAGKSLYGAYDMAGNVWEWTSSLYRPYPYDATDGREDLSAQRERVLRGGSWYFEEGNAISIFRLGVAPADFLVRSDVRSLTHPAFSSGSNMPYGAGTLGFRCAMDATL